MKAFSMVYRTMIFGALCVTLAACAGSEPKNNVNMQPPGIKSPELKGEKLEWSSRAERPAWTMSEPDTEGEFMYFVGISGNTATEVLSRDDALRNSTSNVVKYLGTLAKDKFERARTSFGLSSGVVDPSEGARQFEKQLAANVAKQLKAKEWYSERWTLPTGSAWKTFVLARIPRSSVNDTLSRTAEENIDKAKNEAKAAATEAAKKQAEDAAEFWEKMKEQGLVD